MDLQTYDMIGLGIALVTLTSIIALAVVLVFVWRARFASRVVAAAYRSAGNRIKLTCDHAPLASGAPCAHCMRTHSLLVYWADQIEFADLKNNPSSTRHRKVVAK